MRIVGKNRKRTKQTTRKNYRSYRYYKFNKLVSITNSWGCWCKIGVVICLIEIKRISLSFINFYKFLLNWQKMSKLLSRTMSSGFESRLLHLCLWVFNVGTRRNKINLKLNLLWLNCTWLPSLNDLKNQIM
jgi:hypothetical protein